ncbi:MAG: CRISPR system precrRNA processing endoribonuclease RAMP protein Cas6 [Clostridia bacterium]|nr:CRISPR system precrRNA processing endoribonuclease RAMP protein Cas6 [Clostridia bacterium]
MTQLGSFNIIGFLGHCVFSFDPDTPETTMWMFNALARFASIMGVGYKTTMGMGQVKINKNL